MKKKISIYLIKVKEECIVEKDRIEYAIYFATKAHALYKVNFIKHIMITD